MDVKEKAKVFKEKFNTKWKEGTMKLNIDIEPEDLLSFDKMIAMPTIKIMYVVGLICIALFGIATAVDGKFLVGVGTLLIGFVLWRIICETAIVLFGIYDRLGEIRNALNRAYGEEDENIKNKENSQKKNKHK